MSDSRDKGFQYYEENAIALANKYQSLRFEDVHRDFLTYLPEAPALVLDVGAGSGRDASALTQMGYRVTAAEPSRKMLQLARELHSLDEIQWICDALPELGEVLRLQRKFSFILVSAVWMHLPVEIRQTALATLAHLLEKDGSLAISLRVGPPDDNRGIHATNPTELSSMAQKLGLTVAMQSRSTDVMGRKDVEWVNIVLSCSKA